MSILGRVFALAAALVFVTACGGSFGGSAEVSYTVSASTTGNGNGTISPGSRIVAQGSATSFTISATTGSTLASVSGCGGSLSGSTYTTGPINNTCQVVATFNLVRYLVTTAPGAGGSISPAALNADHGSTATFTITPDSGWEIDSVSGCDGSLSDTTYTTGPITAACTVTASFRDVRPTFTVTTAMAGDGSGTIAPDSATVAEGQTASFTVTPAAGSAIASVTGCDGSLTGGTYTTGPITANCQVEASFFLLPPATYSVTTTTNGNGSGTITPDSAIVEEGQIAVFQVVPGEGSTITSVTGCDGSLVGNSYTTGPINANCQIVATFTLNTYVVTASAGDGGSIAPIAVNVEHGATTTFAVTPDEGYNIASVSGCSGTLDGNTYTTGPITGACTVTASFSLDTYVVTATAGEGGSISPASRTVAHGDSTTFTVTPATGYSIDTVSGCDGSLAGSTYTTGPITSACTVTASFSLNTYEVTAIAGEGGSIDPASRTVEHGDSTTFTVTPDDSYNIASVTGCGGSLDGNTYTTGPITGACTVTASFSRDTYVVTATAGEGGSISPASRTVEHGNSTTFTVTPTTGYSIDTVSGCNGSLDGTTYTTGPITGACTVTASFSLNTYQVTATAGDGGSITPISVNVEHGATTTFTVTPADGFDIASVTGCNGSLSGNTYTTGAITANCQVVASFELVPPQTFSVTTTTSGNGTGTLTPGSAIVEAGQTATFQVNAGAGSTITSVTGCGGSLSGNTYTTGEINADCQIVATFSLNTYVVTASAGVGGSIDPGTVNVEHGSTASFTVTPETGYSTNSVTGCDGTLDGNNYTTGAITSACTVTASFSPNTYEVLAIAGDGGSIDPASRTVEHGATTTFTVTPDEGYDIASVTGCGGALDGATYTTGAITGGCIVTATFSTLAELLGGMYDGVMTSSMSLYSTDSTTITFAVDGYDAEITKDAYLGPTCVLDGSLAGTEFPLSGSGTFQCSDLSEGTWSSDTITGTNETALLSEITMMTGDEVYTIKMSGFRAAPAVNYDPALDYWLTGVGLGQFAGRYEGSMQSLDACANLSFQTSPTDLVISIAGNHILLEQEAFFEGACRFEGEIDAFDGGVIAASGHFQCANSDQGSWQTPHLVLTGADSIFAELLVTVPGRGCSYTAKYLGFRGGGPDPALVDPEPSAVMTLER